MTKWFAHRQFQIAFVVASLTIISACSTATVTTAGTAGSPAPGATSAPTPLPSATQVPTCASVLPGSSPVLTSMAFADSPTPSGTVVTAINTVVAGGDGVYQVNLRTGCVASSSVSAIQSFFVTQFPSRGWAKSTVIPFDGKYMDDCGDPYCWTKDKAPRFIGLEDVTDHGSGVVTFKLRIIAPPAEPTCPQYPPSEPPAVPSEYKLSYNFNGLVSVPMPPLTQVLVIDGTYDGSTHLGNSSLQLCSSGSVASVKAFFNTELPAHGWSYGAGPCAVAGSWYKGKVYFTFPGSVTDSKLYAMNVANCA